jgi:hypothetical protein
LCGFLTGKAVSNDVDQNINDQTRATYQGKEDAPLDNYQTQRTNGRIILNFSL